MNKNLQKLSLFLLAGGLWLGSGSSALGQINLNTSAHAETFDGMSTANAVPTSWEFGRYAGTGSAALSLTVNNGSANAGGVYNVGSVDATDRALGTLASGGAIPAFGTSFRNTSGTTMVGLKIDATMEQWRTGSNAVVEKVVFEYSTDATSLLTGTWLPLEGLDLVEKLTATTTAAAVDGNANENRTPISGRIMVSLPPESVIWVRWRDADVTGSDGLYAIDDFTAQLIATDATAPIVSSITPANGATDVDTNVDLILNFNEPVVAGTGQITLTWGGGSQTLLVTDQGNSLEGEIATFRNITLLPATTYSVQIGNTAFRDESGNAFNGVSGNSWSFTTRGTATPSLLTSVSQINFPVTALNKNSVIQSYTLSGANLAGEVTVAVTGPFQISKTDGNYGTEALTFTQAEIAANPRIYVRFMPATAGSSTGTLTHTSTDAQQVVVNLSGIGIDPYNQNFNDPAFLTNSGWTQYSVAGAQVWASTNFGRDCLTGCNASTPNKAAQINGYSNGNVVNEDWLISPAKDLASFTNTPVLQFWTISAFAGDQLKLKYSTNYTGSGDPAAATWVDLPGSFPAVNSSVWTLSQGIELPKEAKVYVAFVYTSTSTSASRWTVDDFKVEDVSSFYSIPTLSMNFGEVASGMTSATQKFTFRAVGYGNVTLSAPTGFQLSADNGGTFASQVVIPQADASAATGKEVLVRFAPTTKALKLDGQITFAATGLNTSSITVSGSSYPKSETFDVATYNLEFFASDVKDGNSEFGPVDDAKQVENITTVLKAVGADVYGIEELSEEGALDQVIAAMPGYAKVISPRYSYSFEPADPTFPPQKIGFVYNTATMQLVNQRVMFEKLFDDVRSGTTQIANYPGGSASSLWSSGRLPFMATFDVTINGITRRVRIIDIHAKSGSANADFERRKFDVQMLKDSLDLYYNKENVILLGDFNDNVVGSINSGDVSSYKSFVDDVANYKALTQPLSEAGAYSFPSSQSFLDHIIISDELTSSYITNSITIEDPSTYVASYASTTSDHLPVFARFNITSQTPLAVRDEYAGNFSVHPNPTTGKVTLQLPEEMFSLNKLKLTVYTLQGKLVLETVGAAQALNTKLSKQMQSAGAGLYLIKLQSGDKTYISRLIKQ